MNSIINIFLYCFFGKLATESHEEVCDCLYESNWPDLPVELQKSLILMIFNSQREIYYDGFGLAVLDLETFAKVS